MFWGGNSRYIFKVAKRGFINQNCVLKMRRSTYGRDDVTIYLATAFAILCNTNSLKKN